jgi:hypothetical protein
MYFQMIFKFKLQVEDLVLYTRKFFYPSVVVGLIAVILLSVMSVATIAVVAQIPTMPSLPTEDDDENDNQELSSTDNLTPAINSSSISPPTIAITSLEDGQEVPVGELTIEGTSSDNADSDCLVYADVNDIAPLQNATATGTNGEDDYSQWTFVYTEDYQSITEGANELTAKISCFSGENSTPVSEWHSVNVTGVATGTPATTDELTTDGLTTDEGITSTEDETTPNTDEGEEDVLDDIPGVPPSG